MHNAYKISSHPQQKIKKISTYQFNVRKIF